jgi:hypothetical protein
MNDRLNSICYLLCVDSAYLRERVLAEEIMESRVFLRSKRINQHLKGLSHEIDFKNFDKKLHTLA